MELINKKKSVEESTSANELMLESVNDSQIKAPIEPVH